ncbi:MAG: sporulation/spore germination protein [Hassallia sp.]
MFPYLACENNIVAMMEAIALIFTKINSSHFSIIYADFILAALKLIKQYSDKIMNTNKKYIIPFIVVAIAASISSCSSTQASGNLDETATAATATPTNTTSSQIPTLAKLRAKSSQEPPFSTEPFTENTALSTSLAATDKTINITLYTTDSECQKLIPNTVSVPAEKPATGIVSKIIEQQDTGDFNLSGYRVSVKNRIATVDLRISPDSKRQLVSLSHCEQFALFGSLRKSLTSNAQLNIKKVRFTQRGKKITL